MQQLVRVRQVHDNGMATVVHIRESACSGDCHKCSGCGAAKEAILLDARNPIGAKPGDLVHVEAASGPVLKAALVMYMLPMVFFFVGYAIGAAAFDRGPLAGCIGFALSIGLAVVYDRKIVKKQNTEYTITGFAGR